MHFKCIMENIKCKSKLIKVARIEYKTIFNAVLFGESVNHQGWLQNACCMMHFACVCFARKNKALCKAEVFLVGTEIFSNLFFFFVAI